MTLLVSSNSICNNIIRKSFCRHKTGRIEVGQLQIQIIPFSEPEQAQLWVVVWQFCSCLLEFSLDRYRPVSASAQARKSIIFQHKGSISPTVYEGLYTNRSQKNQRETDDLTAFFALLGSVRVKARHKHVGEIDPRRSRAHGHSQTFFQRRAKIFYGGGHNGDFFTKNKIILTDSKMLLKFSKTSLDFKY